MKPKEPRLRQKVALITGASRGLGKAMALRFAEEGASVAVNYFKSASPAREICEAINAAGGKAICVQADAAQPSQVHGMVQTVLKELGPIDILVNNASVSKLSSILETSLADLDLMVGVNLKGTILCVQAVARGMMNRKYGRILNISSLAGLGTSFPGLEFLHLGLAIAEFLLTDRPDLRYLPPELWLRRLTCPTILRTPFFLYSRPLWRPNCGLFAVSAARPQRHPLPAPVQVCLKLTWRTTYSRKPVLPCTFLRS